MTAISQFEFRENVMAMAIPDSIHGPPDYLVVLATKTHRMISRMLHYVAELHTAGGGWGTWDIKMS